MSQSTHFTKLNDRQRKYREGVLQGMSRRQALDYAGYSENTRASRVENQTLTASFAKMVRIAVPAHKLAHRIAEGLDAQETKFFQKDGNVVETRDVVAWGERRAYAELAAKFGGYIENKKDGTALDLGVKVVIEHIGNQGTASAEAK